MSEPQTETMLKIIREGLAMDDTPPTPTALTREQVEEACKETAYRYFGDYAMSPSQRDAVDVLERAACEWIHHAETIARLERERDAAHASETHWFQVATDDGAALAECREQLAQLQARCRELEEHRQYHMHHINRLASSAGLSGETSETVIDQVLAALTAREKG